MAGIGPPQSRHACSPQENLDFHVSLDRFWCIQRTMKLVHDFFGDLIVWASLLTMTGSKLASSPDWWAGREGEGLVSTAYVQI
jgi:hypothetical protein